MPVSGIHTLPGIHGSDLIIIGVILPLCPAQQALLSQILLQKVSAAIYRFQQQIFRLCLFQKDNPFFIFPESLQNLDFVI